MAGSGAVSRSCGSAVLCPTSSALSEGCRAFIALWNGQQSIDVRDPDAHSLRHLGDEPPACGSSSVSSIEVRAVGLVGRVPLGEVKPISGEPNDDKIILVGI